MQHDIYSLGVCLLEIGLWRSFVYYEGEDSSDGATLGPYLDIASSTWDIVVEPHGLGTHTHLLREQLSPFHH